MPPKSKPGAVFTNQLPPLSSWNEKFKHGNLRLCQIIRNLVVEVESSSHMSVHRSPTEFSSKSVLAKFTAVLGNRDRVVAGDQDARAVAPLVGHGRGVGRVELLLDNVLLQLLVGDCRDGRTGVGRV